MTQMAYDPISGVIFADGGSNELGKLLTINVTTATATIGPAIQSSATVRRIAVVNVVCPVPSGG